PRDGRWRLTRPTVSLRRPPTAVERRAAPAVVNSPAVENSARGIEQAGRPDLRRYPTSRRRPRGQVRSHLVDECLHLGRIERVGRSTIALGLERIDERRQRGICTLRLRLGGSRTAQTPQTIVSVGGRRGLGRTGGPRGRLGGGLA